MTADNAIPMIKNNPIAYVYAPEVSLAEGEEAANLLLHFYRALGWNGNDFLDPRNVRVTKYVYNRLRDRMCERCSDPTGVGLLMLNIGPGVDDFIPEGDVCLLEGWIKPASTEGRIADAA